MSDATETSTENKIVNINVGVLGHVDSGKTSLSKALSTHLSTASLDKNVQSQQRGITLDLGFSAFFVPLPGHLKDSGYSQLQFTLVDCPGHASLIKTIIGGAQIIDMMLLVIDVTKGIQTQTAECLVIGELLCNRLIVVLNKVDLLKDIAKELPVKIEKLRAVFAKTKFGKDVPMVGVSANPGGGNDNLRLQESREAGAIKEADYSKGNMQGLVDTMLKDLTVPDRISEGNFYFAIDHCFQIKGQGTVLTGTILKGSVSVNQVIEIPSLGLERKVKSMQMFHKPVNKAIQGDRLGICVTQVDAKEIERGIACAPGSAFMMKTVIAKVEKIRFYKLDVKNGSKFHMTIGHFTTMATVQFFATGGEKGESKDAFNMNNEYEAVDLLKAEAKGHVFAVLDFEKVVTCQNNSRIIGSKLDSDINLNNCRLAFCGDVVQVIQFEKPEDRAKLKVYRMKERQGTIERIADEFSVVGKDLFSKETDMSQFIGMKVSLDSGEVGTIEGGFGKSGKFKVYFADGLPKDQMVEAEGGGKSKKGKKMLKSKLTMRFKKFLYNPDKKAMVQE